MLQLGALGGPRLSPQHRGEASFGRKEMQGKEEGERDGEGKDEKERGIIYGKRI